MYNEKVGIFGSGVWFGKRYSDFELEDLEVFDKINRRAKKHHTLCEQLCNYDDPDNKIDYRLENTERKIIGFVNSRNEIRKDNAWKVEFQHDPRGYTVKLFYKEYQFDYIGHTY